MKWWDRLRGRSRGWNRDRTPPVVDAAPKAAPSPTGMKISRTALADALATKPGSIERRQAFEQMFPVAPVPEWVPNHEGVKMAMDDATAPIYGFASFYAFGDGEAWPGFPYLSELMQRAEYRLIVETYAKEMTRKWIKLTYKGDEPENEKLDQLGAAMDRFKIRDLFRKIAEHDGAFGGGQLYIDTGHGSQPAKLASPLVISEKTIPKGGVRGFYTVEPMWSYPNVYNSIDPLAAGFFSPQTWFVQGKVVHRTRLLTMISAEMPDILKPAYSFRGISLSQRAKPYVDNWLRTRQSVSDLVHSFSIVVLKTLLQSQLVAGDSWGSVFSRLDVFNATRDNRGAMVIDKESEEMDILAAPLGTLDALQAQAQEQLSSVSQIPLVKLLGITPSGLNASSDGEIRVFYDNIRARQEHLFGDSLHRVIEIIQLHEFGEIDRNVGYEFEPLWQLDEAGAALVRKTDADTGAVLIESGVIAPEEERKRVADDPSTPYQGLDVDDMPEPPIDPSLQESVTGDPAKGAETRKEERSGV